MIKHHYRCKLFSIISIFLLSGYVCATSELQLEYSPKLGQINTYNDGIFFATSGHGLELYKQEKNKPIVRLGALPVIVTLPSPHSGILDNTFQYSALSPSVLISKDPLHYESSLAIFSIKIDKDIQTQTMEVLPKTVVGYLFPLVLKSQILWVGLSEENDNRWLLIIETDVNGKITKMTKTDHHFEWLLAAVKLTDKLICIAVRSQEDPKQTQLVLLDENFKIVGQSLINGIVTSLSTDGKTIGVVTYIDKIKTNDFQLHIYDAKLKEKNRIDLTLGHRYKEDGTEASIGYTYRYHVRSQLVKGKFFIAAMKRPYESFWIDMQGKVEGQKSWVLEQDKDIISLDIIPSIAKLSDGVALIYRKSYDSGSQSNIILQRFAVP